MKLLLESVNLDEIGQVFELGVLDGVSTSRPQFTREGVEAFDRLREICLLVPDAPLHVEVAATDPRGMVEEGESLAQISSNLIIKLPAVKAGMKAAKVLAGRGINVNVTLCFQPPQALLAAKAGAVFVSPLIVPADTSADNNMKIIGRIRKIFDNYGYSTQIIAAGIRSPLDLMQAALAGADAATVPFAVIDQMLAQPLMGPGLKTAVEEWARKDVAPAIKK